MEMLRHGLALGAAMLVTGAFGLSALDTSALAVTPIGSGTAVTSSDIQLAATVVKKKKVIKKDGKRKVIYSRSRHGPRYRVKRPGYSYYYGGYYYAQPWWTPGINLCIGC
jgi:hypothetical protein